MCTSNIYAGRKIDRKPDKRGEEKILEIRKTHRLWLSSRIVGELRNQDIGNKRKYNV